ncbi:mas-related G-protein coupled receptor member H-like [Heteronotia binoei]|uniref:mas-related G-protein coupled receptor member H-like n=1 Tax=Heteronotia binoei TaxID=13085 RepID=UPI00292FCE0E|nr:mas-related G-protein coupled receptor member H-like [Heteronotia binoei]
MNYSYEDAAYISNNSMNIPDLIFNLPFNLNVVFITFILVFLICIAGIVGNSMVIWLLGFRMKRNPFTTYVLNLAAADMGVLVASILGYITATIFVLSGNFALMGFYIYAYVWASMYITDQFLLTVISVDRCVAVLFPLWHRCHRPPRLSGTVCVSVWVLSFLIAVLDFFLSFANEFTLLQFTVNVAICTPVMAISTVILSAKICTKSQQRKRGKLLPVILLALFCFLLFGLPVNYFYIVSYTLDDLDVESWAGRASDDSASSFHELLASKVDLIMIPTLVAFMCTILNCSINPLIYFLVGRKKKGRSRQSMKAALQRIFKDDENCRGQEGPRSETQL